MRSVPSCSLSPCLSAKQPQGAQPGPIPFAGCVFYLLVQWEEVNAAVLGTVCISICLQFLLGLCVPVLGCHRDLPESEVLVISESRSSLLWSFPRTSYHPSPPAVWPSPFSSPFSPPSPSIFSSSGFHPRNVRATSGLLQTKLKQQHWKSRKLH